LSREELRTGEPSAIASTNDLAKRSSNPSSDAALWGLSSATVIATRLEPEERIHGDVHLIEGWAEVDVHGRICGLSI
jgi:hypothetical protein